jgi:phospholipid-binding lipoprotein MlaA
MRDAPARALDFLTNPLQYTDLPWEAEWGERVIEVVHQRSELLPLDETLQRTYDPYAFIRDAWAQQREFNVFDGNPPPESLEDVMEEEGVEEAQPQQ